MNAQEQTEKKSAPVQFFDPEQIAQINERLRGYVGKELETTINTKIELQDKNLTLFFFLKRTPQHFGFATLTGLDSAIKQIDRKLKLSWYQFGKTDSKFEKKQSWLTIEIRLCNDERDAIFLLG